MFSPKLAEMKRQQEGVLCHRFHPPLTPVIIQYFFVCAREPFNSVVPGRKTVLNKSPRSNIFGGISGGDKLGGSLGSMATTFFLTQDGVCQK